MKIERLSRSMVAFPRILADIPDPPAEIFIIGKLEPLLQRPRLAIVGSRKLSPYGLQVTTRFAETLTDRGVVVVSGLAFGADAAAHRAVLDHDGLTLAVLASGLDHITPAAHTGLAKRIVAGGGVLLSEYPPGTPPLRHHFIARNRLIAGLSDGVLVTEAAATSGTMHTAAFALEQGRTVMAVPGNITAPNSVGTNNLIKTGAIPATSPEEVAWTLGLGNISPATAAPAAISPEEAAVLTALGQGTGTSAELQRRTGLEAAVFSRTLTILELNGHVRALGGDNWGLS